MHYNMFMEQNEQLVLRISKDLKTWIMRKAKAWNMKPSAYVRMILEFQKELEEGKGG